MVLAGAGASALRCSCSSATPTPRPPGEVPAASNRAGGCQRAARRGGKEAGACGRCYDPACASPVPELRRKGALGPEQRGKRQRPDSCFHVHLTPVPLAVVSANVHSNPGFYRVRHQLQRQLQAARYGKVKTATSGAPAQP